MVFHFLKNYLFSSRSGAVVRTIARVCVAGIGISVAAMIVVLNVMNGFNEAIHKRLLSVDPHISIDLKSWDEAELWETKLKTKESFQGAQFLPIQQEDVIFRTIDALFSGAVARGLNSDNIRRLKNQIHGNSQEEELEQEEPWTIGDNEIILGDSLARSLGVFIGDELNFIQPESLLLPQDQIPKYEKLKVKYIFRSDVSDVDSNFVFYPWNKSFRSFSDSLSRKYYLHIYLRDKDLLDGASEILMQEKAEFKTWKQKNSSYLYALKMERVAMGSFLSLTIVIASFTIIMVLSLLMAQKRKDIAMLMTIGLSPKKTQNLFTQLGFQLGAMGSIFGFALGMFICYLLANFNIFELPRDIYYDYNIPVKMNYEQSFAILFCALVLSYLGSALPVKIGMSANLSKLLRPGVDV